MVRLTLQRFPQFEVCGEAEDGIQAVAQAKKTNPDVVILNVVMPCLNGYEVAREIKKETPQAAIVIFIDSRLGTLPRSPFSKTARLSLALTQGRPVTDDFLCEKARQNERYPFQVHLAPRTTAG